MNENRKINILVAVSDISERDRILRHIEKHPAAHVLGGCANAGEIVATHRKSPLDILFLDVNIPPSGAFSFLRAWPEAGVPQVVFLAQSDEHAIAAFQFHPLDFLLMPVHLDRVDDAVTRLAESARPKMNATAGDLVLDWVKNRTAVAVPALRTAAAVPAPRTAAAVPPPRTATGTIPGMATRPALPLLRLMVKSAGRINFLRTEEIDYVEADRDYVRIHNGKKKHLLREKISRLEQQLPADRFLRIHRSTIVNIDRIKEMQPLCYGEYSVILHDGTRLTLSRSFRERVFSHLVTAA
jgi:two-component system LytT family response regulator